MQSDKRTWWLAPAILAASYTMVLDGVAFIFWGLPEWLAWVVFGLCIAALVRLRMYAFRPMPGEEA